MSMLGTLPNGKAWANVVGVRYAQGASNPGINEISAADAILSRIWTGSAFAPGDMWLRHCGGGVATIKTIWYVLDGQSPPHEFNHTGVGQSTGGQELPGEVAFVVTWRTLLRGRQNRGRTYLPSPTTSMTDANGKLLQTVADSQIAQMNGVKGALAPIQWEMGVLSMGPYKTGASQNPTPHFTPVDNFTMDLMGDVQRHRK